MENTSLLLSAMVFGSIGLGFFIYGKKQKAKVPLGAGIALFIFPYFVSDLYMLIAVGVILVALPFFVKI
jgi:hypothetical protein